MKEEHKERINSGIEMFIEKVEKISKEKDKWTLCELGCVADMIKDLATAHEKMAKAHYYYSERSDESF